METLLRHLRAAPSLSPTVIVTHAHYDHAGNLNLLPCSQVIVPERGTVILEESSCRAGVVWSPGR